MDFDEILLNLDSLAEQLVANAHPTTAVGLGDQPFRQGAA
jgi:hypothetical protein